VRGRGARGEKIVARLARSEMARVGYLPIIHAQDSSRGWGLI